MGKQLRTYYSHSQMETFSHCGLKYQHRYISGIDKPSSSNALVFGSAIHKAIELYHLSIVDTRMTAAQMMEAFTYEWEHLIEDAKVPIVFKKKEKDALYEVGLDIIAKYHKDNIHIPPPCMFVNNEGALIPAVEIDFTVEIHNEEFNVTRPIHGKIDLVTPIKKEKNAEIYVIDHKTASEDYTQFKSNNSVQLSLYAYAFRQMLKAGRFPYINKEKEDAVGYNVFKKIEATKSQPDNYGEVRYIRKAVSDSDIDHMLALYSMMDVAVANKVFLPNYGRHCTWCDYKDICTEYKFRSKDALPDTSTL